MGVYMCMCVCDIGCTHVYVCVCDIATFHILISEIEINLHLQISTRHAETNKDMCCLRNRAGCICTETGYLKSSKHLSCRTS